MGWAPRVGSVRRWRGSSLRRDSVTLPGALPLVSAGIGRMSIVMSVNPSSGGGGAGELQYAAQQLGSTIGTH